MASTKLMSGLLQTSVLSQYKSFIKMLLKNDLEQAMDISASLSLSVSVCMPPAFYSHECLSSQPDLNKKRPQLNLSYETDDTDRLVHKSSGSEKKSRQLQRQWI